MKNVLKTLSITTVLLLIITFQPTAAQSDIDTNRMNRDINIMENVLEELFKTSWSAHGNNVQVNTGSFSFGRGNDINGTYLADYGIIFTIPGGPPGFVMTSDAKGKDFSFNFEYGDETNGEEVTEESITNKIVEFLRDYGSTIGQLSDNQKVMVIYKANRPHHDFAIFRSLDEDSKLKEQEIATISIVANAENLKAYRAGNINEEQFRNRLNITSVDASANQEKDLKVMASILKTTFEDTDEENFEVRGPVNFLKLDNFGILFSFDARYSKRNLWDFSVLNKEMEKLRNDLSNLKDSVKIEKVEIKKTLDSTDFAKQKDHNANLLKAYNTFLKDLKSTIVDYGRTLRSVESNQQILVTVNLHSRHEDIPERIHLQVSKSVLENSNPEQVLNEINVREY
ncbi:hypothetical protein [Fodinibius sp.]|uniref:hypothetical protein n=1 Tax=Fodinibius sp. TaxID=1872440 RepID=UPI002ACE3443|nr:hypothetical protein [Fodinibius sp.]MDZ7659886.1 hypothetical protein [Fodinibius sp.]